MEKLIQELKERIIETLELEELSPEDIEADAPLFGEGLGLDSVDALELVVMVDKYYSIKITDREEGRKAFQSIKSLAQYIMDHKEKDKKG